MRDLAAIVAFVCIPVWWPRHLAGMCYVLAVASLTQARKPNARSSRLYHDNLGTDGRLGNCVS